MNENNIGQNVLGNIQNNNIQELINIGYLLDHNSDKLNSFIKNNNTKNLLFYFYNKEIYNKKGTKILNKDDLLTLIEILNDYLNRKKEFIILFFNKININILLVIVNGYIKFDFSENENNTIYNFIKSILPLFFDKMIFYYIYNKLSKIFRTFYLVENKELLFKRFIKITNIWKLLYEIENKSKVNQEYIALIGKNIFTIDINKHKNKSKIKSINFIIEFEPFFYDFNNKNNNFSFLKIYYKFLKPKEIKYNQINLGDEEKIKKIQFKITDHNITYHTNENCDFDYGYEKIIMSFILEKKNEIEKIEILKNYIGAIKCIRILIQYDKNKSLFSLRLNEYVDENKNYYFINKLLSTKDNKENIKLYFTPENDNFIGYKVRKEFIYNDIRYYGGLECFIPIFKIIKYFIEEFNDQQKIGEIKHYNHKNLMINKK